MNVKRNFPRLNENWKIIYRILEKEQISKDPLKSLMVNVSGGGICLQSRDEILVNTALAIEIYSEVFPSPIMALAKVVWCDTANQVYEVGAEFLWIGWKDSNAQQTIANYISSAIGETFQE